LEVGEITNRLVRKPSFLTLTLWEETGVRSKESGVRIQETGGIGRATPGVLFCLLTPDSCLLTSQRFGFVHRAGNGFPVLGFIAGSAFCAGVGGGDACGGGEVACGGVCGVGGVARGVGRGVVLVVTRTDG